HGRDGRLRLSDADRLDDDDVIAGRLTQQHGLAGLSRHAAELASRGGGADERLLLAGEALHARLVAEQAAARARARGIDREHRHALVVVVDEQEPESLDERALADAGSAADAEAMGAARVRQDALQQLLR